MYYRKKPVIIEARQLAPDMTLEQFNSLLDWIGGNIGYWSFDSTKPAGIFISIKTLEGSMKASEGDFIIKGVKGEFYPCRPDIFAQTYEIAPGSFEDAGTHD